MDVFAAECVDGVDDAPVLFETDEFHYCVVVFVVCGDGGGEEEGAEGCDEEGEAGDTDHCCGLFCVCLEMDCL